MESELSFYNIAKQCQSRFEKSVNSQGDSFRYKKSVYATIDCDDKILVSESPDIILKEGVCRVIMIHQKEQFDISLWHPWYTIEYIDENYCVHTERFDNRFNLRIRNDGPVVNQEIHLSLGDKCIYKCKWPNEECLQTICILYQKCRLLATDREVELLGELTMKDESVLSLKQDLANATYSILLLTKERDQYKSLLDEIKDMITNK